MELYEGYEIRSNESLAVATAINGDVVTDDTPGHFPGVIAPLLVDRIAALRKMKDTIRFIRRSPEPKTVAQWRAAIKSLQGKEEYEHHV